jgi:hypothetical protein
MPVLLLVLGLAACGTSSGPASKPAASSTISAATSPGVSASQTSAPSLSATELAPNPNAPVSHCLLGGRPMDIEFYGVDANNVCARYVPVLADLGQPNLPVHTDIQTTDIPSGFSVGCGLSYPLSFGNLHAYVYGYTNSDTLGDAGPLAAKVCARLLTLGWVMG